MKITSFNPIIIAKDTENIIKLYEAMGFEVRHHKDTSEERDVSLIRMKDANGFYLDVVKADPVPSYTTGIRINVDDFDKAHDMLLANGFRNYEGVILKTPSSRFAVMESPDGYIVNLCQHIKD